MVESTNDPPSVERSITKFEKWVRAVARILICRKTLLVAFWVVVWTDRIVRAVKRLLGDF